MFNLHSQTGKQKSNGWCYVRIFLDIIKYEYRSEIELNQLINNIYNYMVRAEEIINAQSELVPDQSNVTADLYTGSIL